MDRSYLLGMDKIGYCLVLRIGLETGMRLSEILKLQCGDLIGNRLVLRRETTKNETSSRRVTVDEKTLRHITEWMTYQAELLKSIGILQTDKTPLLCNARGNKLGKGKFENWWGQWRNDHGFDGLLFHELRHTQATLLLANGVDYRTVMERMGFAGPALMMKRYAHAIPGNDEEAANVISKIAKGEKVEPFSLQITA